MKIFAIITVARQLQGELVFVKPEKAFKQASQADAYVKDLSKAHTESIKGPNGNNIECYCERGVFEIDVEE